MSETTPGTEVASPPGYTTGVIGERVRGVDWAEKTDAGMGSVVVKPEMAIGRTKSGEEDAGPSIVRYTVAVGCCCSTVVVIDGSNGRTILDV